MNEQQQLMRTIQAECFACRDVALYLDSHPSCQNALAYYRKHQQLLEDAVKQYEEQFGPLVAASAAQTDTWTWIDGPWPWELEE